MIPFLPGIAFLSTLVWSSSVEPAFLSSMLINAGIQLIIFMFSVHIPAAMTARMSYVDIAWPFGLSAMGFQALYQYFTADAHVSDTRILVGAVVYLLMGLRMSLGAIGFLLSGRFNKEFPRYEYQRLRWKEANISNIFWAMQLEIFVQCVANMCFLCLPFLLLCHAKPQPISFVEWTAIALFLVSYSFESVADFQKQNFLAAQKSKQKKQQGASNKEDVKGPVVCDVGLWNCCRHPNYFGEWMVWNSLVLLSLIQLFNRFTLLSSSSASLAWIQWSFLLIGVVVISWLMYRCLVHYTGAEPAEYYSLQKRPEYAQYKKRVKNMFWPDLQRLF